MSNNIEGKSEPLYKAQTGKFKGVAKKNQYVVIKQFDNDSNIVFTDATQLDKFIKMLQDLRTKLKDESSNQPLPPYGTE